TGGLKLRVRVWKLAHGLDRRAGVTFVPQAVQLLNPGEVAAFIEAIGESMPEPPVLVVIDTLARSMTGGDENGPKDMGQFIASIDRIRETTGAGVLVLHHTGWKETDRERGHTSLRAATDTVMLLKKH